MPNTVTRFLLENTDIHGAVVELDSVWQAICHKRDYPAALQTILGEMCAVSTIIATNLKDQARLTFQLSSQGPVPLLVIDCSDSLNLRAYAKHEGLDATPVPFSTLLEKGQLLMSLELPGAKQPYQSYVPVEGNSVAEVFSQYLSQSVQQPAYLFLAARPDKTAGLFLQALPDAEKKDADGWNRALQLAATLKAEELFALGAEDVLGRLFAEETVRVYPPQTVRHDFPQDREKIASMLRSLGQEEIFSILAEHGEVLIHDDLSNHEYRFSPEEALALFTPPSASLH